MSTVKENMPSELNESVIDEKATVVVEQEEGQEKTSAVRLASSAIYIYLYSN